MTLEVAYVNVLITSAAAGKSVLGSLQNAVAAVAQSIAAKNAKKALGSIIGIGA